MENLQYYIRNWYLIPKGIFRLCFILLNNFYCIPTYVVWMLLLWPLRRFNTDLYYKIEGYFFHWLLAMVSMWSWWAGYDIVEMGDDITPCLDQETLVIANHQSTGDVPLLMACFNTKKQVLPNIMWIMDSLFKYTNFGIVSVLHEDFFIMSGKNKRDASLRALTNHLMESFIPRKRKWMVLFPEGGFLRKRKAVSQKYAEQNNLPRLEYVTIPRIGAMQVIMDTLGPKSVVNNNSNCVHNKPEENKIKWIVDITIGYPKGEPIDLGQIVFGHRQPCKTILLYRVYSSKEVPEKPELLTKWLIARWEEKEQLLEIFYKTGKFPVSSTDLSRDPQLVTQDSIRFLILHIFFIMSTYIHVQLFRAAYYYCNYFFL